MSTKLLSTTSKHDVVILVLRVFIVVGFNVFTLALFKYLALIAKVANRSCFSVFKKVRVLKGFSQTHVICKCFDEDLFKKGLSKWNII